jgi:hypothetical protein
VALNAEHHYPRLVLCGSMTFFGYMRRIRDELSEFDIEVALPDAEDDVDHYDERQFEMFRRQVVQRHIGRVRSQRTIGILVTNFDKHGIADYIGPSTFAEIATAAATNKRIFVLQDFPDVFRDTLSIWDAVPLRGSYEPLLDIYRRARAVPDSQLELFAA